MAEFEVNISPENRVYAKPRLITDNTMHYCPGCSHGVIHKLVAEVIDEMGLEHDAIGISPVGCSVLAYNYIDIDWIEAAHGRAAAVATAAKRLNPSKLVFTYQGDGELAAIVTGETIHACNRGDRITIIYVNNAIYGMTGGQMAPTTLPHQKTATSPKGKDPARYGTLNVVDVLGKMDIAYLARGELVGPAGMNNCKKLIRKAFEHQLNGDGFCLVELLSPCPTNLNMPPVKAREHVHTEMTKYFPVGEYIDKKGGDQA